MKKIIAVLLIATSLIACRNKKQNVQEDAQQVSKADTLNFSYDSVKVFSKTVLNLTDTTKATISYPVFKDDSLNHFLKRKVFDFFAKEEPVTTYADIASSFVKGYDDFIKENTYRHQTWFLNIRIEVLKQYPNYLALKHIHADYAGGAHGNTNISFINYDVQNHREIVLDSLIEKGKMPALLKIAESIFRENEKLTATEPLDEKYFFDKGKFALAQNFYIDDRGLVFLYNPYEIKPYVYGTTTLIIPFSAIRGIGKPNTILTIINQHASI